MASSRGSAEDFLGIPIPERAVQEQPQGLPFTHRERLQEDVGADVDIDTGGPAGVRAQLSVQTPSNVDDFLTQSFGQDGWRRTKEGNVVYVDKNTGGEILLDEAGFSMKDFADLATDAPQIIGGLGAMAAATAASGSAGVTIPMLALVAAAGGVFTSSVTDALQQANLDVGVIKEIVDKRGLEGVIDFTLGLSTGGLSKLGAGRLAKGGTPEVPTAQGVAGAVERIESATGVRVPVSVGEVTGNPTLQRIESIGEKLPLSSDVFRKQAIERDLAIDTVQKQMVGENPASIGKEFANQYTHSRNRARFELQDLRERIDANLQTNLDTIGDSMSPSGRSVTTTDAGATYRAAGTLKRDAFLEKTKVDYELARQAPGGREPIVGTGRIRKAVAKIEKEVPQEQVVQTSEVFEEAGKSIDDISITPKSVKTTEKVGTKPAKAFIPPPVKRFLDSLKNLDNMTIDQARMGRNLIYDAIQESEALPGVNTRFLKSLSREFTASIDDAVSGLPDGELKRLLGNANKAYKENADQYLEKGVVELFRDPTAPGFVEDSALVENAISSPERLIRIREFLGKETKEWGVFKRSIYNNMLDNSRNILKPNMLDTNRLSNYVSKLNPKTREILFGEKAKEIENTLRTIAANTGDIPVSAIDDLSGGMATAVKTAAIREKALSKEYNDTVLKPFLRNEIGVTEMSPDKFTRHVMANAEVDEIDKVFKILGDNNPQRDKFERSVIMDILDKGTVPATAEDIIQGSISEGDNIISGRALFQAMKDGYGPRSVEKIEKVLGKDRTGLLRDLATIQASKEQKAKSAAGGLISGFIISSMARGDMSALPMIAQYRVLSWMMTDKKMSKILMSKKPVSFKQGGASKIAGVITGPMLNDLADFVGPEDQTAVMDFFNIPAERRPKKPNADAFLELDLTENGRTAAPDIRLRAQE